MVITAIKDWLGRIRRTELTLQCGTKGSALNFVDPNFGEVRENFDLRDFESTILVLKVKNGANLGPYIHKSILVSV